MKKKGILLGKSVPRNFHYNFNKNCGPDRKKISTNGEPSTNKLNTTGNDHPTNHEKSTKVDRFVDKILSLENVLNFDGKRRKCDGLRTTESEKTAKSENSTKPKDKLNRFVVTKN